MCASVCISDNVEGVEGYVYHADVCLRVKDCGLLIRTEQKTFRKSRAKSRISFPRRVLVLEAVTRQIRQRFSPYFLVWSRAFHSCWPSRGRFLLEPGCGGRS